MKIQLALLVVSLPVILTQSGDTPHGSNYIGGFICPLPERRDPGEDAVCSTSCSADSCAEEATRCCPTSPGCRDCVEAIASDSIGCEMDGDSIAPLTTFVDGDNDEDCYLCVCIAGEFYCSRLDACADIPIPIDGGSCSYGDRDIQPGEFTFIMSVDDEGEEECKICVCGSGAAFCREEDCPSSPTSSDITCEYNEDVLSVGESVPAEDGCNECMCTRSGDVACTDRTCLVLCEYNGEELEVGESVRADDGCNECTCTQSGEVGCTEIACPPTPCYQPVQVGPCDDISPSWFYNSTSGECERFDYGGCEGNQNRFGTQRDCQAECDEDACPDGATPVDCDIDPCDMECSGVEGAECRVDYCQGCRPVWYLGDEDVTDQCETGCPDGVPIVLCFADPCDTAVCDEQGAECVANYCGGCNAVWFVGDREVCQTGSECPEGVPVADCLVAPCDFASCPAFPMARCVDDYCGGCNARFYNEDREEVTDDCELECDEGEALVVCLVRPCEVAECPGVPDATCTDDYCGGCNARWFNSDREEVTERCFDSPGVFEPSEYPVCPAMEVDTCSEDCGPDSDCPDGQLCCAGCGRSCRDPVLLPYYEIPLACPSDLVSLASDSAACDVECQSDSQCPSTKICCRSGCSSSCQDGEIPPMSCDTVRELLDSNDEREDDENDEEETETVPPIVGRYTPGCSEDGWFNPVQVWENNIWCVNVVTGTPTSGASVASESPSFSCPNCTHNGEVFYAGQTFYDDCNTCRCTANGLAACTRRACLDPCFLSPAAGMCDDRVEQYFFNSESRQCEEFVYSGCGGNENRFSDVIDCLHACRPDSVCLLERDDGERCDAEDEDEQRNVYFYYNAEEGECETMVAHQCGGNGNRFQSGQDCLETCDPSNPGPTDIDGNQCWLIQCGIPICDEDVELVFSDDYCCPFCEPQDEEECRDDEFTCRDRSCIPGSQACDGLRDCDDGSDEREENCDLDIMPCEYRCSDEQCIPEDYVCDGELDCGNARDEHDCEVDFVPGVPFYPAPMECPEASDVLGACDASRCVRDTDCEGEGLCCPNNCNQRLCATPVVASPACEAVVARLSPNVSYIPECVSSGDYRPLQCSRMESDQRLCWCVNVLTGIPYTPAYDDRYPECERCSYNGMRYTPGQTYTAEDGCNTCICTATGDSVCTRIACAPAPCVIGDDIRVEHGDTEELDCLSCTCMFGELSCTRKECASTDALVNTIRVEMTFSGDFSDLTRGDEGEEELSREVMRTLLRMYGESMDLDEDQIASVEVRKGSVIVVVELIDTTDQTGADVTILVSQIEQDYDRGSIVIKFNNSALVPSGEIVVDNVTGEDDEEEAKLVWWHGVIIGVGGVAILLLVAFLVIGLFSCIRKERNSTKKLGNENYFIENTEMVKVPLDETP